MVATNFISIRNFKSQKKCVKLKYIIVLTQLFPLLSVISHTKVFWSGWDSEWEGRGGVAGRASLPPGDRNKSRDGVSSRNSEPRFSRKFQPPLTHIESQLWIFEWSSFVWWFFNNISSVWLERNISVLNSNWKKQAAFAPCKSAHCEWVRSESFLFLIGQDPT